LAGAKAGDRCPEGVATPVGGSVIGHDALDGDAMGSQERPSAQQEPRAGQGALVAEHLGVGQPGVVVNGRVDVVVTGTAASRGHARAVLG